jgi:hypothetical protein
MIATKITAINTFLVMALAFGWCTTFFAPKRAPEAVPAANVNP